MKPEEIRYRLLRELQSNPNVSQRQLAGLMGVSLGKTHYALKALMQRGFVKADNFRRSDNKRAYLYKLTPAGVVEKSRAARGFLARKVAEHAAIQREIEALRAEIDGRERTEEPGRVQGGGVIATSQSERDDVSARESASQRIRA